MTLIDRQNQLLEFELSRSYEDINEIEKEWVILVDDCDDSDWGTLIQYNLFRLRNLSKLNFERPAVLIGAVNNAHFPDFHTVDLLKVADVISLTTLKENETEIDRLYYSLVNDSIQSIITRLPEGFKPFMFWDSQAEHGHPQPLGLANAPFLTIASVCHVFYSPAIKRLLEVFDYVLPSGEVFDQYLDYSNSQVLRIPFGLNWASMHHLYGKEGSEKNIDVSVTFSSSVSGPYAELRNDVLTKMESLKAKYSDKYNFVIQSGLDKEKYTEILQKSRISVNVVGFHGPYNYRTCEVINAGALLFQANVESHGVKMNSAELFDDGDHFVSFDLGNLEQKLLELLSAPDRVSSIAQKGRERLENDLNYKNLFTQLFEKLKELEKGKNKESESVEKSFSEKFKKTVQLPKNKLGDFHCASFLWEQINKKSLRFIGAGLLSRILPQLDDSRFYCNLLAIIPEVFEKFGFGYLQSLIASRDKQFADSLPSNDLKQIVIQIYSLQHDHVVMAYNMISLAIENDWIDRQQLPALANQAFGGKDWQEFDMGWLLRYPVLSGSDGESLLYDKFQIPLLLAKGNPEIWTVYRDYILHLANDN